MTCGKNPFDTPLHGLPRLVPRDHRALLSYRCLSYDHSGCDGVDVYERACVCGCHVVAEALEEERGPCGCMCHEGAFEHNEGGCYHCDPVGAFTHPVDGQGGSHRERSLMADAEQLQRDAHAEAQDAFASAKRIVGVE